MFVHNLLCIKLNSANQVQTVPPSLPESRYRRSKIRSQQCTSTSKGTRLSRPALDYSTNHQTPTKIFPEPDPSEFHLAICSIQPLDSQNVVRQFIETVSATPTQEPKVRVLCQVVYSGVSTLQSLSIFCENLVIGE